MITAVFLLIGFLIAGGAFGAQVIGAFDIAQYWLWFRAVVVSLFALIPLFGGMILGGAVSHDLRGGKLGMLAGVGGVGFLGAILSFVMVASTYAQLWISYYIVDNVNANAQGWSELTQNDKTAIVGFGVLLLIGIYNQTKNKGD